MNLIDLIIIAIIVFGIIRGYSKGLIIELSSFFGIFISFFIAGNVDNFLSNEISAFISVNSDLLNTFSFIIIFILSYLLIIYLAKGFTKLAKVVYLGLLNSVLGGVFGGLKLILILLIITKIIFSLNLLSNNIISESSIMIHLHVLSEILFNSFEITQEIYSEKLI
tara:strand:- start:117 stop:614 length:498 start_codon:yes stop_codon:yes gene_type:complete